MKSNLTRLALFLVKAIVIVLVVDFLLGSALDVMHSRMKRGERARAYYAINRSKADVYIFGSSRALYHYNPLILEDSLGMPVYNAGRSAQTLLYHLPVLKMIVARQKPKIVVLDINESEFVKDPAKYDLLNSLLPYYRKDEGVRDAIDIINPSYRYFSWSRTLPYNSSVFSIVLRNILPDNSQQDIKGYIYMKGSRKKGVSKIDNCADKPVFDQRIIDAFHEFVRVCADNNIKLFVIISPRFSEYRCKRLDLEKVQQELDAIHVDNLNFVDDVNFIGDPTLIYDQAHLNYDGSVKFSKIIASYLKREYRKP